MTVAALLKGGVVGETYDDRLQLKQDPDIFERLYSVGEKIGAGSFGQVFACSKLNPEAEDYEQGPLCVKIVPLQGRKSPRLAKFSDDEKREFLQVFLSFDHCNVVRYHRFLESDSQLFTVMSRSMGPDLPDFVEDCGDVVENDVLKDLSRQILEALKCVQNMGLAHRDIKPGNFRFKDESCQVLQLLDFGFAKFLSTAPAPHTVTGTLLYAAPEVIVGRYGLQCDLWSAGIVIYELHAGQVPFETSDIGILRALHRDPVLTGDGVFRGPEWTEFSKAGKALIGGLLTVNPLDRLSAELALASSWFCEDEAEVESVASPAATGGLRRCGSSQGQRLGEMKRSNVGYFGWNLAGAFGDEPEEEPWTS
eukprot:TRINITY_DN29716_c0_g1_i2.p1 TRINITY_DN29716_c0_g1~~TRINITY_DN29716_c0_g1_i2.p1  ORF type:complete len:386 (-),score=66.86 TRINITY_DN29716_c0_g1_i2:745-1839(-)